jgi:hypothetical protein
MSLKRQRGQAIPYVAFLILILSAAALVIFDIGRMVNARIQAQNAADAAALAAVSVKVSKHHVDTLMRAAMSQEALISQAEIRAAQAVALRAFIKGSSTAVVNPIVDPENPVPGNPLQGQFKDLGDRYRLHTNLAYKHAVKLHRERLGLQAWYKWLERNGRKATLEAARVGYALNLQGYDNLADEALKQNLENELDKLTDLPENRSLPAIDGFIYAEDAASTNGTFGKTFLELTTRTVSSQAGTALLKYLKQYELRSSAAAQLMRQPGTTPISPLTFLAMNWYSPRLMAIEDNPKEIGH